MSRGPDAVRSCAPHPTVPFRGITGCPTTWRILPPLDSDAKGHGAPSRGNRPLSTHERLRAGLEAALAGAAGAAFAADQLCHACVELLHVDGAAISVMHDGSTRGTFGSSGELSRRLDEYQFTFGEGPCLDAASQGRAVLVPDIAQQTEHRWPAFAAATLDAGVHAVFALPVSIAATPVGVLDLFRSAPGPLSEEGLAGGLLAAELAALPLLNLMTADVDWADAGEGSYGWSQLASLERVEVYQATGMIMEQLDIGAADALIRLRAHAFAAGLTASEVAWAIVDRRLSLNGDDAQGEPGSAGPAR